MNHTAPTQGEFQLRITTYLYGISALPRVVGGGRDDLEHNYRVPDAPNITVTTSRRNGCGNIYDTVTITGPVDLRSPKGVDTLANLVSRSLPDGLWYRTLHSHDAYAFRLRSSPVVFGVQREFHERADHPKIRVVDDGRAEYRDEGRFNVQEAVQVVTQGYDGLRRFVEDEVRKPLPRAMPTPVHQVPLAELGISGKKASA